jgi:hypothetical protein
METQEGFFTKSSIFELNKKGEISANDSYHDDPHQWMKFSFEFRTCHNNVIVSLMLEDLKDVKNPVKMAEAAISIEIKPQVDVYTCTHCAYLISKLEHLSIAQCIGRAVIEMEVKWEHNQLASIDRISHSQLAANAEHIRQPSVASQDNHCTLFFPQEQPVVTVLFHSVAMEESHSTYAASIGGIYNEADITNLPAAHWNITPTHIVKFKSKSILTSISLKVPHYNIVQLNLFRDGTCIFAAFEGIEKLAWFHHYHRGWLMNYDRGSTPWDPLLKATKHIITTIHHTPSVRDYAQFIGLEFALVNLKVNQEYIRKQFMMIIHLIRYSQLSLYASQCNASYKPLFLQSSDIGENHKTAMIKPGSSSESSSAYFFFEDSQFNFDDPNDYPVLIVHVCCIHGDASEPWWDKHIHCWSPLPLDQSVHAILTSNEGTNGVRVEIEFNNELIQWSVGIILRWKTQSMPFLTLIDEESFNQIPSLNSFIEPPHVTKSPSNNDSSSHNVPSNIHGAAFQPIASETAIDACSTQKILLQTIDKLQSDLEQLQESNTKLVQENGFIKGQLAQLIAQQKSTTATASTTETKRELEACTKVDLVRKILILQSALDREKGEKETYQSKVMTLQNKLLSANETCKEFASLQEAHKGQQKLVQKLQRRIQKYYKCYQTSLEQEELIKKYERIVASSDHEDKQENSVSSDESDEEEQLEDHASYSNQSVCNLMMILEQGRLREEQLKQTLMQDRVKMCQLELENQSLKKTMMTLHHKQERTSESFDRTGKSSQQLANDTYEHHNKLITF